MEKQRADQHCPRSGKVAKLNRARGERFAKQGPNGLRTLKGQTVLEVEGMERVTRKRPIGNRDLRGLKKGSLQIDFEKLFC